ncbi:hypothetical protein G9A89_013932 [Geosiphon pyriformis]|nr:hypothetical protein G9A89_013932 [Geosiphon pyriformis]
MPCNNKWCPKCYAFSIPLLSENNQEEIEFGEHKPEEKKTTIPIYLTENQSAVQLKYFDNNGKRIKPKKAHEINAEYDLRYPGKDTLILQPKFLTKINLRIALKILLGAMVQIASQSLLASKGINIREEVIDVKYIGNITIMLQNETDKPFRIEHAEKIAQAIYLLLIKILGLQSINNREQLGKSKRRMQEHHEIYTCSKPTTTQQIFESNEQICLKHEISIPNVYIPKGMKKFQVTFYNPNNYSIVLLNKLKIGIIHSSIFQDENPQIVFNFIEIIRHTLLPNSNIISTTKNYHLLKEKLS